MNPVSIVNRRSGEVALCIPSETHATVDFDAYIVTSFAVSLKTGIWTCVESNNGCQTAKLKVNSLSLRSYGPEQQHRERPGTRNS